MFQFHRDDEGMTVRVTGDAAEALDEIAEALELNVQWPIFPLALDNLYRICRAHVASKESLRDIVMVNEKETQGMFMFDIEQLKIEAKKMEMNGLGGNHDEDRV